MKATFLMHNTKFGSTSSFLSCQYNGCLYFSLWHVAQSYDLQHSERLHKPLMQLVWIYTTAPSHPIYM